MTCERIKRLLSAYEDEELCDTLKKISTPISGNAPTADPTSMR